MALAGRGLSGEDTDKLLLQPPPPLSNPPSSPILLSNIRLNGLPDEFSFSSSVECFRVPLCFHFFVISCRNLSKIDRCPQTLRDDVMREKIAIFCSLACREAEHFSRYLCPNISPNMCAQIFLQICVPKYFVWFVCPNECIPNILETNYKYYAPLWNKTFIFNPVHKI